MSEALEIRRPQVDGIPEIDVDVSYTRWDRLLHVRLEVNGRWIVIGIPEEIIQRVR